MLHIFNIFALNLLVVLYALLAAHTSFAFHRRTRRIVKRPDTDTSQSRFSISLLLSTIFSTSRPYGVEKIETP